jgi:hypothetical protein
LKRTSTDWTNFLNNSWVKNARNLTHELNSITRQFQKTPCITEQTLVDYAKKIESLRSLLHVIEEDLNIIQTREY